MNDEAREPRAPESQERREPTFGSAPDVPLQDKPPSHSIERADNRIAPDRRLLRGYELELARGESIVDNVEVSGSGGLNQLILTDRRLIIRGRDHQTVYPLRAISRLAVVRYVRWWMVLLGVIIAGVGAAFSFLPAQLFPPGNFDAIYMGGAIFLAGLMIAGVALLRPVLYVELKSVGGDMRLRLAAKHQALADFLSSLAQNIR